MLGLHQIVPKSDGFIHYQVDLIMEEYDQQ